MYQLAMVIDDIEIHCQITDQILRFSSFAGNVVTFTSAADAFAYLHSGAQFPDIIFLDLNMPEIDGYGFLDMYLRIPSDIRGHCMVLLLAAKISNRDAERLKSYPIVKKLVTKPLNRKILEALVHDLS